MYGENDMYKWRDIWTNGNRSVLSRVKNVVNSLVLLQPVVGQTSY
jgi:hypothetical protein